MLKSLATKPCDFELFTRKAVYQRSLLNLNIVAVAIRGQLSFKLKTMRLESKFKFVTDLSDSPAPFVLVNITSLCFSKIAFVSVQTVLMNKMLIVMMTNNLRRANISAHRHLNRSCWSTYYSRVKLQSCC